MKPPATVNMRELGPMTPAQVLAYVNAQPSKPQKKLEQTAEVTRPKVDTQSFPQRIEFTALGTPVAAPRMTRSDKWNKRECVVNYRNWINVIRAAAPELPPAALVKSLSWTAYFEPPESWSKKKRIAAIGQQHKSIPDRDNLDKAVLDALYKRDEGIAHGTICKMWDWKARLEIVIEL